MCIHPPRPVILPMPRPRPSTPRPAAVSPQYARFLAALASAEIRRCDCPLSLMPVCFLGRGQFCHERRKEGTCPCKPRYLPVCLLERSHGCSVWERGHRCTCPHMYMPECFSPGCNRRRRGKLCGCPRWPGQPCQHITSYAAKARFAAAFLALQAFCPPGVEAESLWTVLLWSGNPDAYRDKPPPGKGKVLIDRETRVREMELRHESGLSLWHDNDIRSAEGETRRLRQNVQGFALLFADKKGGRHGRVA